MIDTLEQTDGQFGPQVKFTFKDDTSHLEETDGETMLTAWSSAKYTEKTKLFKWARAALGAEFNPDVDFQASKMTGKRVLLSVEKHISATGTEFNKVGEVMALPRVKKPQPKAPPPPESLDETEMIEEPEPIDEPDWG
jgi:hypothetical protein